MEFNERTLSDSVWIIGKFPRIGISNPVWPAILPAMPEPAMTAAEQRAYDEALKRIGECARRRATALDLSRLRLTRVPSRIGQLVKLTTLDLSNNLLDRLPPELGELAQLARLDLSHNPLARLPAVIAQLTALTALDLSHTTLGSLPPEIGGLVQLARLDLAHNPLAELPPEIGRLAQLTRLYLTDNRLAVLPPECGKLASLTRLYLSHNRLRWLPPELGQLASLTRLDLSHNQLEALPPELGQLARLTVLEISNNNLAGLPPELGQLAKLAVLGLADNRLAALPASLAGLEMLERLVLHDNPALQLLPSILGADPRLPNEPRPAAAKSILEFYFARQTGQTRPLDEVRLILLGRAGAGKTSIAQALRDLPFRDREASTPGVAHSTCTLAASGGAPVTARVWDFSGQELTHPLHPLFLSERSLYVVVLTGDGHNERADADYWLGMIQACSTAGQVAPVIVALSQWNVPGRRPQVERAALRASYPFIRGFVEMDCKAKKGIPALKAALFRELERMPWVREPIPEPWDTVRRALGADTLSVATGPVARLTDEEYRALCVQHGVSDVGQQDYLAEILHHLGVVLNFRNDPRLRSSAVLSPGWLTDNLYALLHRAAMRAGVLTQAEVAAVLHAEPDEAARTGLMEWLERLALARALTTADGRAWLVPHMLPASPPASLQAFDAMEAVGLRFTYQELPDQLVARLGARRYDFIEEERSQKLLWRDGLVFLRKGGRALMRLDSASRQLVVTVIGAAETCAQLAALCQSELRAIHAECPGLVVREESRAQGEWRVAGEV